MFRNIIWDLDGTLFDTYPAITESFRAALTDLGKDVPLDWIESLAKKSVGFCETTLAKHYSLSEEEIDQKFVEYYDLVESERQLPFPGVTMLCEYICSIGGKNVIVTHRRQVGTARLLTVHRLAGYFAGSVTQDDGYPKKPDPAAFEAVIEKYNLKRVETLAVGDRDIDVLAGQAAGVFTCLFGEYIEGVNADLTINNFYELHRYILAANH
jgi:phosphoglycolate phosphatase-like HAD superfamily hydrolase